MSITKEIETSSTTVIFNSRCKTCYKFTKKLKKEMCIECISCTGKEAYSSLKIAESISHWYNTEYENNYLEGYKCIFCNKYHLGHNYYRTAS